MDTQVSCALLGVSYADNPPPPFSLDSYNRGFTLPEKCIDSPATELDNEKSASNVLSQAAKNQPSRKGVLLKSREC